MSFDNKTYDDALRYCWSQQECWLCLDRKVCSWCPVTSTCVPNQYQLQILAPIYDPDICPWWSERWELRTSTFGLGCHVSTITFLTCIITILSTFVVIGLVAAGVKIGRHVRQRFKNRSQDWWKFWGIIPQGWWRGWRLRIIDVESPSVWERRPLLA